MWQHKFRTRRLLVFQTVLLNIFPRTRSVFFCPLIICQLIVEYWRILSMFILHFRQLLCYRCTFWIISRKFLSEFILHSFKICLHSFDTCKNVCVHCLWKWQAVLSCSVWPNVGIISSPSFSISSTKISKLVFKKFTTFFKIT